jgi:hypothetical protein
MRLKDFFTPARWKSFIVWLLKLLLRRIDGSEVYLEFWEVEQYMYRMLKCPDCVSAGKCTHCGCHTNGRMMNRDEVCSADKWGGFMSEEEWKEYKEFNKIKFQLHDNV